MIEFRALAYFATTCQQLSLTKAAEQLGIAASSLSGTIKALETSIGVRLFDRTGKGLVPSAAGRWLYRESLHILQAETFLRSFSKSDAVAVRVVPIHIDLEFSIGRISSAVSRSIGVVHQRFPEVFFRVYWLDDGVNCDEIAPMDRLAKGRIDLRYLVTDLSPSSRDVQLVATENLILARLKVPWDVEAATVQGLKGPIIVPRIPPPLQRHLEQFLRAQTTIEPADLFFTDEDPGSLQKLVSDRPDATFLVPSSSISRRLGLLNVSISEFDQNWGVPIVAMIDSEDAAARSFVAQLRTFLAGEDLDQLFEPRLTLRQVNYFDLLRQARSVTGAAKLATVAQPAVTEQLGKLEAAVGGRLFVRSRNGLELTKEGSRFAQASSLMASALDDLKLNRPRAVDLVGGRVELGILPSVGPDGYLISRITKAVEAWRVRHPNFHLRILEEPNSILQERIARGTLDLGIVTTRSLHMARFDLGSSEELALIANPAHRVLPEEGPIAVKELANLPLVLPTAHFGIRQRIDAVAHDHGIAIRPVIEVDSLSMCVALIRESALCTILPPSELSKEIQSGELIYRQLSPKLIRIVQIIYSAKRALTHAERDLIELLRFHLQTKESELR